MEIVIAAAERFQLSLSELHNDYTAIKFSGQYARGKGKENTVEEGALHRLRLLQEQKACLKQLLSILTSTADGGVPVHFRHEAGNAGDSRTHEETWEALCRATWRRDFLHAADVKLCNEDAATASTITVAGCSRSCPGTGSRTGCSGNGYRTTSPPGRR